MLNDFGITQKQLVMYYDNTSAINITNNLIEHNKTNDIDIRHHFIGELVEQDVVDLEYVTI